jgi:hypothetical protein
MKRRPSKPTAVGAALALGASLLALAPAHAQEGAVVAAPEVVAPATPQKPNAVAFDHYTARLVGRNRFKVGVLALEYGITDWLSVGTDPPAWAVRSVTSVLLPNLHLKGMFVHTAHVDVTGQIAGYYANLANDSASGHLFIAPVTLFVSTRLTSSFWLHFEGAYNYGRGFGAGDVARFEVGGTAAMRTAQVGVQAELQLSRVVHLIARGRYQFYETPIVLEGNGMVDPYTTSHGSLEVRPRTTHPAMGIAGVALTWKHVGAVAGAGYGHYFVPGANLALPYNGVVPEGSLWAVF